MGLRNKILIGFFSVLFVLAGFLALSISRIKEIRPQSEKPLYNGQLPDSAAREVIYVPDPELNFLFFGDLMLDRHVKEKMDEFGLDYPFIKLHEKNFFDGFDLIGANLEGAVTDGGAHYRPDNLYDFAFSPAVIENLKKYNFNFFNLANNHFSDQGEKGMKETTQNLADLEINYVGCQDKMVGDCSAAVVDIQENKIGLAGFSMVYGKFDLEQAKNKIIQLAEQADFVIANVHWGTEYTHQFDNVQRQTARALIDAGADIIIGHHPHVVQGMEVYEGKPIFYSLGNFVFDQYFSAETQEELALKMKFRSKELNIEMVPLTSHLSQIDVLPEDKKAEFFEKFISWSDIDEEVADDIRDGKITVK